LEKLEVVRKSPYIFYIIYLTIIIFSSIIIPSFSKYRSLRIVTNTAAQDGISFPCNCVIFRLDDITEFGIEVKSAILDHFLTENKKLVAAIIPDKFGNKASDDTVYAKVKEGYDMNVQPIVEGSFFPKSMTFSNADILGLENDRFRVSNPPHDSSE
jgi:hypothetical protein